MLLGNNYMTLQRLDLSYRPTVHFLWWYIGFEGNGGVKRKGTRDQQ